MVVVALVEVTADHVRRPVDFSSFTSGADTIMPRLGLAFRPFRPRSNLQCPHQKNIFLTLFQRVERVFSKLDAGKCVFHDSTVGICGGEVYSLFAENCVVPFVCSARVKCGEKWIKNIKKSLKKSCDVDLRVKKEVLFWKRGVFIEFYDCSIRLHCSNKFKVCCANDCVWFMFTISDFVFKRVKNIDFRD